MADLHSRVLVITTHGRCVHGRLMDTDSNLTPDTARTDFRNPENFQHDVNSVAGLLKQFFKDLPDPLLTSEFYNDFIEAARKYHSSHPTPWTRLHSQLSVIAGFQTID